MLMMWAGWYDQGKHSLQQCKQKNGEGHENIKSQTAAWRRSSEGNLHQSDHSGYLSTALQPNHWIR